MGQQKKLLRYSIQQFFRLVCHRFTCLQLIEAAAVELLGWLRRHGNHPFLLADRVGVLFSSRCADRSWTLRHPVFASKKVPSNLKKGVRFD